MTKVRLAVLSDLHIWRDAEPESWELAKRAFQAAADSRVDHVVIAGDLFDCATAFEEDAATVRARLKKLGLWKADRLTIVPGNHDLFHTPHHGSIPRKGLELARALRGGAGDTYEAYCEWAGDLVKPGDRLDTEDLYPFAKQVEHVVVLASDTTGPDTAYSVNGYWATADDANLRRVDASGLRTVLAIHHPPESSPERHLAGQARQGYAFGFPPRDFKRLERFADAIGLDAIVCGHIHDNGEAPWTWEVGEGTRAFMMGRTGGVHDATPCIGILTVPERGDVSWKTARI